MRIGFDGKRATHNTRGLGNYSRTLLQGLMLYSRGDSLIVFTPPFKNKDLILWCKKYSDLQIVTPQSVLGKMAPGIWRSFRMGTDIETLKIDLYHGLSHEIPMLTKKRNFKVVVTIHDLIFLRYPEYFPLIDRMVYWQKFSYAAKNADLIIAICEQTKRDICFYLKVPENKVVVHYQSCAEHFNHPISLIESEPTMQKYLLPKKYFLHVGAFEPRKNQHGLIEAFYKISQDCEHTLVFVGQGKSYLQEAKKMAEKLKLQDRIIFLDSVTGTELPHIYQRASLFIFPSFFEGFGIPVIEALYSKIPVITSNNSSLTEVGGPKTIYVNPLSTDEMAEAMMRVICSVSLQKEMIECGLHHAVQFTLENSTKKLLDIYHSLG